MKRERQCVDARRAKMFSMIRERQKMRVEELAAIFGVSLMTIRRDLQAMEGNGLIGRFYGGAGMPPQLPVAEKDEMALYRRFISRRAASLVEDGDRLLINGSTTALDTLDFLGEKRVKVFTNNGAAVNRPFPAGVELTLSGGVLRGNGHIMTGDCAMWNLLMVEAEKALIGCTGISSDGEILCGIPAELGINETMISHAAMYYILADHTKIGKASTYASCSLEKPGVIITDERASPKVVERLRTIGMMVIQVGKSDFPVY